ncbi:hypothetical protein JVU11DRAFT_8964 [Chiua virens]|nr:hypothetical protein JVU11DRAFT_8964 [Chiua virens]
MPLRITRSKVSGLDPLQVAISTTALARDLLGGLQFPPAVAAASVVLLILETIQNIQTNKVGCIALARRAAQILADIDDQMRGRWDSAPQCLVQNLQKFEGTLKHIYGFMKRLADSKWRDRLLRKNSIEDALVEYTGLLDEAAQSFQLATLIDLHYTVGTLSRKNIENTVGPSSCTEAPPPYKNHEIRDVHVQEHLVAELTATAIVEVPELTQSLTELTLSSQRGEAITEIATDGQSRFRRYHQSEIVLRGRSCLKEGWWAGGMEVQVQGQPALIKRYEDPKANASRQWLRDVKMLQNLYHPNLPQMLGFSDDENPTPFILLSNVKTKTPEVMVREMLRTDSLATCMELMFRTVISPSVISRLPSAAHFTEGHHQDTALYIQRQLNLTDNQVQDFFEVFIDFPQTLTIAKALQVAGFRVDSHKTLVVGLPPPREGKWYSARNYGLAHTLLSACLRMLPNQGTNSYDGCEEEVTVEMQQKINHLVTLARSLLPSGSERPELPSKLQKLIEDSDVDAPCLTLRQIRDLTFHTGTHEHSWHERNVPPCKFSVGDLGYVPKGKDWNSFVRLENIVQRDAGALKVSHRAHGEHWCWENVPIQRQPLQAFETPMNISAWPVAVPPYKQIDVVVVHEAFTLCVKDAWQYLLENGKTIAEDAGMKPEDVVLVTHAGTHQDFYVKDFRPPPFRVNQSGKLTDPRFAPNPLHRPHSQGFQNPSGFGFPGRPPFDQLSMPSIVYLFTALSPSHEPHWSSSPMCAMPGGEHPLLDRHFTYRIG